MRKISNDLIINLNNVYLQDQNLDYDLIKKTFEIYKEDQFMTSPFHHNTKSIMQYIRIGYIKNEDLYTLFEDIKGEEFMNKFDHKYCFEWHFSNVKIVNKYTDKLIGEYKLSDVLTYEEYIKGVVDNG